MKRGRTILILNNIIQQLKAMRISQGISHDKLAVLAGISRPAVSLIENGKRKPTLLIALKLSHALNTELSTIIDNAERDYPKT